MLIKFTSKGMVVKIFISDTFLINLTFAFKANDFHSITLSSAASYPVALNMQFSFIESINDPMCTMKL